MKYDLYTISGAPRPWRVALGLVAKQLDFDVRVLEGSKKEQKAPDFLALNPRGRTPVLKRGDFVLTESLAILSYLEKEHPSPPLFGTTTEEHARIWEAVSEGQHDLSDAANALLRPLFFLGQDETNEEVRRAALAVKDELNRLEQRIADSPFLVGPRMSAADCVCFPHVRLILRATERFPEMTRRLELDPFAALYPRLARWIERIEALPGYEKTFPSHWTAA
jgi:glutathione S-transferase